jgi:hypothetical protein
VAKNIQLNRFVILTHKTPILWGGHVTMVRYCPSETMSSDCLSYDKKIAHETSICRPLLNSVVSCVLIQRNLFPQVSTLPSY